MIAILEPDSAISKDAVARNVVVLCRPCAGCLREAVSIVMSKVELS